MSQLGTEVRYYGYKTTHIASNLNNKLNNVEDEVNWCQRCKYATWFVSNNTRFNIIPIFQPNNVVYSENINNAIQYIKNIPNDVAIISGNNEEIQTNKLLLAVISPTLRNLLSSPLNTFQIIFLPDVSTLSIRNLQNIINSGFSVTEKLSYEDIKEITETAQLLSIDITEFCYDEIVPSLLKSNRDTGNIGLNIVENERNDVPGEPIFDTPEKIYDESSESVIDALLRIFDSGNNDSEETNFNTVDYTLSLIHI